MMQPIARQISRSHAVLEEDFIYKWTSLDGVNHRFLIEEGYIWNGASIPRWLWTICGESRRGILDAASVIHDLLYEKKGRISSYYQVLNNGKWESRYRAFSREEADKMFAKIMNDTPQIKKWRVNSFYKAVDIFGKKDWKDSD